MSTLDNLYNALTKKAQTATKDITREMVEDWVGDAGSVDNQIAFMSVALVEYTVEEMVSADLLQVYMSCPYFEEGYIGTCGASESRYVPSIERMEIHCFKQTYLFPLILLAIVSFSKGVMFRKNSRLASVLQI